ncbi:hypothetical protein LWI28_008432 [Acer negundo]|uniref:Uncharacterized protein n=1 Tax=Acer negundo TaxID=4023 RepID=A0AAD5I5H3_ACENE|nr:hypothetical protein LWI28_008432 [Acer negundo]
MTDPKGQFYLRAKNPLKFIVAGANVKYPHSWCEEWVVVEEKWGSSVDVDGVERPIPIQFSGQEKWGKGKISEESQGILEKILGRHYVNVKYPVSDPFDSGRVDRYLKISLPAPSSPSIMYPAVILPVAPLVSSSPSSVSSTTKVGISLGSSWPTDTPHLTPAMSQTSLPAKLSTPPTARSPLSEMAIGPPGFEVSRDISKAFRFTVAMEKQVNVFKEATISARVELEDTKQELARSKISIEFLNRSVTEAEKERDKALADSARLERALDIETLRLLRREEKRDSLKSEKVLLRDENQLLRGSIGNLEAKIDNAFGDGYFYSSYEVAKAFPPPHFDLMASLG